MALRADIFDFKKPERSYKNENILNKGKKSSHVSVYYLGVHLGYR